MFMHTAPLIICLQISNNKDRKLNDPQFSHHQSIFRNVSVVATTIIIRELAL